MLVPETQLQPTAAAGKPADRRVRLENIARTMSVVGLVSAGWCLWYRHELKPVLRIEVVEDLDYFFVLTASIACIGLYLAYGQRWRLAKFLSAPGLIVIGTALCAAFTWKLGFHQFGGFDEGLIVHAATYYAHGLRPFVDFPCPMPPFFMAGIRAGVLIFGLRWSAVLLAGVVFECVTCIAIFKLLERAEIPRHYALLLALAMEASTMVLCPFWWYNNTSTVAAIWLLVCVVACLQSPQSRFAWINLPFALATVLTSKPNALPIVLGILVLLVTRDKWQWVKTSGAVVIGVGIAWAICRFAQMPPAPTLRAYREVAKLRENPFAFMTFWQMDFVDWYCSAVTVILVLFCFLIVLVNTVRRRSGPWQVVAICGLAGAVSLVMVGTNAELMYTVLILMVVATALLSLQPREQMPVSALRRNLVVSLLSVFFVASAYFSATHLRILGIGERMFYEMQPTTTIHAGYFKGLEAAPRLQAVLSQTATVLAQHPNAKVFFGPRMEFEYAVFDKAPTPGMPLLWDEGNLFPPSELPHFLSVFKQQDPDLLIFLKNDYIRMGIVGYYIRTTHEYRRIDIFSELTVYTRNPR